MECDFKNAAKVGDIAFARFEIGTIGVTSVHVRGLVYRNEPAVEKIIATLDSVWVCVNHANNPIPHGMAKL